MLRIMQIDGNAPYYFHKYNGIGDILGIHPVTAGRCAEKGKKIVENHEGILGYP